MRCDEVFVYMNKEERKRTVVGFSEVFVYMNKERDSMVW
jgi:hypothetical protein